MSRSSFLRMIVLALAVGLAACGPVVMISPPVTPVSSLPAATLIPSPTRTPTGGLIPTPAGTPWPLSTQTPAPTPVPVSEYTAGVWECWDRGQSVLCSLDHNLSLKQMAFVSDTEAWTVGAGGYIARWDGYTWTRVESPTDKDLNDVAFLAADDGWAVGEGGVILHWDGNIWSVVKEDRPPNQFISAPNWSAVAFSGSDYGWVVGYESSEGGSAGYMMHWNGKMWEKPSEEMFPYLSYYTSPPFILDVLVFSSQDAWAVGEARRNGGLTLHWDGTVWKEVSNPTHSARSGMIWLLSISGLSGDDIWIGGWYEGDPLKKRDGVVLHWDGTEWTEMRIGETGWVSAILMLSDDDGWVGGDELFHWNGQNWEKAINPAADRVVDIESSPDGEVWALTQRGGFLHLRGQSNKSPIRHSVRRCLA